jgi:hypothetical protein
MFAAARFTAVLGGAVAAVTCAGISTGSAGLYGNAPWCAVADEGGGNVNWDCEYGSVQQCVPNILGGNRGFCNINPYWQGFDGRRAATRHWHQRRHAER